MRPLALAALGCGIALMCWSWVQAGRDRRRVVAEWLEAPDPQASGPDGEERAPHPLTQRAVAAVGGAVARLDRRGALGHALERARIPLRPGEYVIVTTAAALAAAALVLAITGALPFAGLAVLATPLGARMLIRRRIAKWRKAFEKQLPGSLTVIASSLAAGHTFLRAIQMMTEESAPPMSEEFARLVAETRLGDPVVDALGRMAERLQIRDLDWVVQAIRIQQTVGGRLADLLYTLSDFIRARDEVRAEVNVLTAEGRISAYVLAGLAPFLMLAIQVLNPGYMQPMFRGWGFAVLAGSGASIALGTFIILRMVRIEV